MKTSFSRVLIAGLSAFVFAGCATSSPSTKTTSSSAPIGALQPTSTGPAKGKVVAVHDVAIEDDSGGYNRGRNNNGVSNRGMAATTASAVGGGLAGVLVDAVGGMVESRVPTKPGEEITVLTDEGDTLVITQERVGLPIAVGERVVIQTTTPPRGASGTPTSRVVRENFAGASNVATR